VGWRLLRWALWLAALSLLGLAGPARAVTVDTTAPYAPTPVLPDSGTFDSVLMNLARAPGKSPRGFTLSSPSLAFRAGAPQLAPEVKSSDVSMLQSRALAAPLAEVPAGRLVFGLLVPSAPGGDPRNARVRDLGQLVLGPNSMLQRTSRALFGDGAAREVLGVAVMGGLVTGLGTGQAQALGFSPGTHFKLFGGALYQGLSFHCGPQFQDAGVDLSTRIHLLHLDSPWLHELYIDGGVNVQRSTGEGMFTHRRVALHLSASAFDGSLSWSDPPGASAVLSLSLAVHAGAYRLHGSVSRQDQSGQLTASGAVMTSQGLLQAGIFVGGQTGNGFSAGLLTMMVF